MYDSVWESIFSSFWKFWLVMTVLVAAALLCPARCNAPARNSSVSANVFEPGSATSTSM